MHVAFTTDPESPAPATPPILFYDGDCGLCTRSVRFFLRIDRRQRIRYAPLQGLTAEHMLPAELRGQDRLSTVVFMSNGVDLPHLETRSEAVCSALIEVGGFWKWMGHLLRWIPKALRDGGYRFIARHRLKIFPRGSCRLPTPEESRRLLS